MDLEISAKEWRQFIDVTSTVIERHPDQDFLEVVALLLDNDVYKKYEVSPCSTVRPFI